MLATKLVFVIGVTAALFLSTFLNLRARRSLSDADRQVLKSNFRRVRKYAYGAMFIALGIQLFLPVHYVSYFGIPEILLVLLVAAVFLLFLVVLLIRLKKLPLANGPKSLLMHSHLLVVIVMFLGIIGVAVIITL